MEDFFEKFVDHYMFGQNMIDQDDYYNTIIEEYSLTGSRIRWRKEDGNTIAVREMSDLHLINCVSMLKKNDPESPWIEIMKQELENR